MRKAINHLRRSDPVLAAVIQRVGPYRPAFDEPDFEMLVRAIVNQQLSGKAAATILGRLNDAVAAKGGMTPQAVLKLRAPQFRTAGISRQKETFLKDLARRAHSGELRLESLAELEDEAVIHQLTQVKGIGVWTAHMFLMFGLRRPDVLPVGDLGIQNAVHRVYGLTERPKAAQLEEIAARWSPWRSVACWYLWRSLEVS